MMGAIGAAVTGQAEYTEQARLLLERVRSIPELRERYRKAKLSSLDDLASLPRMSKDDLALTYEQTATLSAGRSAYLFASGGSTGQPKVCYLPADMFIEEIQAGWAPLDGQDVFVNMYTAGRLWSSHYFHNEFARVSGSRTVPLGSVTADELLPWLGFCRSQRVTALGATPTTLYLLLDLAAREGYQMPELRAVLWTGETWNAAVEELLAKVAPNVERWGLYGSMETWVIGANGPGCSPDTFHPLPYQHVLIGDDGNLDVTCLHPRSLNLLLRYRPGDAVEAVECACGNGRAALRVLGRRDNAIKLRGRVLHVDELVREAMAYPGVRRAQLVCYGSGSGGRAARGELEMHLVLGHDALPDTPDLLRRHLLATSLDLDNIFVTDPGAFRVRSVDTLVTVDRTAKTPNLIRRQG